MLICNSTIGARVTNHTFETIDILFAAREWKSEVINSGRFNMPSGHHNPNSLAVNGYNKEADPVYVGTYRLSKGLVGRVGNHRTLEPKEVPKGRNDVKVLGGYFYHSEDPLRPLVCNVFLSSLNCMICSVNLLFGKPFGS